MHTRLPLVALLAAFLVAASLPAQDTPDPVGDWSGTLSTGAVELRLVLHVARDGKRLTATLDSVDQGANGIPVDAIAVKGNRLTFEIKRLRASYEGEIDGKGNAIDGTFTQGVELPLRFERSKTTPKIVRPQMPKAPFPYRVEDATFAHGTGADRVKLAGTLTLPKGDGPFPAAILISGSGPQDRDESLMGHKPFLVLADHLTRHGIAVLRYDDRGVGKSTGDFANAVSDDFADDAEAAFRFLRKRDDIAKDKIGFIGHSEGGLVAPIVAARNDQIAFLVMMAGPGVPGTEILGLQIGLIAKANGAPEDAIAETRVVHGKLFALIESEQSTAKLRKKMREVLDEALADKTAAEVPDKDKFARAQIAKLTSPWMLRFLRYDPRPTLAKVKCPVLAINGALDLQVDAEQNLPEIEKALKRAGNADFEIVKLPALNHLFQHAKTGSPTEYAKIEETLAPEALQRMTKFIRARFAK